MGYYTQYTLTQEKNPVDAEALEFYLYKQNLVWLVNKRDNEPTKWYEHEEDMKKLSEKFPKTVFKLHGDGEESGDIWEKYYHGGAIVHEVRFKPTSLPVPDLSKF